MYVPNKPIVYIYFLSPEQDEEWPLENTMPSSEQLFREYIETYKKYT